MNFSKLKLAHTYMILLFLQQHAYLSKGKYIQLNISRHSNESHMESHSYRRNVSIIYHLTSTATSISTVSPIYISNQTGNYDN